MKKAACINWFFKTITLTRLHYAFFGIGLCLLIPLEAFARIKLITLPVRERVIIQLDHPQLTLVEEERIVPVVKGVNQVDFSWANTRIDPDTLVFRVLASANQQQPMVKILSVSYPPNENALVWSVYASDSGAARVRISYALGGLDKQFHYRATAAPDEKTLSLSQYMRINNQANEAFQNADFGVGFGQPFAKSIGVNETKEVLLENYKQVPVQKTYSSDPVKFGYLDRKRNKLNVPMHYVIANNTASGLGQAPLPYGKVRIFQQDSQGSSAFLGEDWGKFTPPEDELTLYLGLAQDIAVRRTIDRNKRIRVAGNLYRYEVTLKYDIENFKNTPVVLDIIESVNHIRNEIGIHNNRDPEWRLGKNTTLPNAPDPEKSDFETLTFHLPLPPRQANVKAQKTTHTLQLILNNEW